MIANPVQTVRTSESVIVPLLKTQEPAIQTMYTSKQSILKRDVANALNGSSVISVGSNQPATRIEIAAGCEEPGLLEVGYDMIFNNGEVLPSINVADDTNAAVDIDVTQYYLPASFCPDFHKIEYSFSGATTKWIDQAGIPNYSRMTSSLFNDFRKRVGKQRFCFAYDDEFGSVKMISRQSADPSVLSANVTQVGVGQDYLDSVGYQADGGAGTVGGYSKDKIEKHTTKDFQHKYIPLLDYEFRAAADARKGIIRPIPKKYRFNFKLSDLLHDSVLARFKYLPHGTNATLIFYWNQISDIIVQQAARVTLSSAADRQATENGFTPNGFLQPYNGTYALTVDNFFVKHYMEQNPDITVPLMNGEIDVVYPQIVPGGNSTTSNINGSTVQMNDEAPHRLYRVYTALFTNGPLESNRPTSHNCENIDYNKWDGDVQFLLNNEVLATFNAGLIDDWSEYMMGKFKDGSLNSRKEIEYNGTLVYDFDTSRKDGLKSEYEDNILKGKTLDKQFSVTPRYQNAKKFDNSRDYQNQIYIVKLMRATIRGGVMVNALTGL